jgi:rhamnosyltransferase subunit B
MSAASSTAKRILIVTAGSHGDVHPFLAIGRELKARGCHVAVLVNPHFEPEVRAAELEYFPFGELTTTEQLIREYSVMDPIRGSPRVLGLICSLASITIPRMRQVLSEYRPDVMLAHHIILGAGDLARESGVPVALAMLAPGPLFSAQDPAPLTQQFPGRLGYWIGRVTRPLAIPLALAIFSRAFTKARRNNGLPAVESAVRHEWHGGDRLLGMWSPVIRAPQNDDLPHFRLCGFPFYDEPNAAPLGNDIEEFLAGGERPLLFCLGSTAVHIPGDFYSNAVAAATSLGRRAILLAGPRAAQFDRVTPSIRALDYAPLHQLAPRCALSVIHGGIGTTAQALRAGRPTLVAPFAHDQFNNGVRVANLGCGDSIAARRLTRPRMTRALDRLLSDPNVAVRARSVGDSLRVEAGASRAADEVRALCE